MKKQIKKGTRFEFNNIGQLEEFSTKHNKPTTKDFKIEIDINQEEKSFTVIKL